MAPKKTNRLKPEPDIATRAEFETVLDSIAQDQIHRDALVLERDAQIQTVREEFDVAIELHNSRMAAAVTRAERYAVIHRELIFGKLKSAATALTLFGFRTGNPTLVLLNRNWTWTAVLEAIKARCLLHLVVTKESVDKDAVKLQLDDATRAAIGTKIEQVETFFVEPKREEAQETRLTGEGKAVAA